MRRALAIPALTVLLTAGSPVGGVAHPTGASAAPAPVQRILNAVSAAAPDDVWAVGSDGGGTLIRHWNGSQWRDEKSPSPYGLYTGVSARASDDAWAVGFVYQGPGPAPTLIAHWDGHSWSKVPSPNPSKQNALYGVSAVAADDAWAVGYTGRSALVLHWDGTSWKRVTTPATSGGAGLDAVSAVSATNVWAVGSVGRSPIRTLVEHWNGVAWKRVKSPSPDAGDVLSGVTAPSAQQAWAVGNSSTGSKTLILHWNGQRWRVQRSANSGSGDNRLAAVSARSATSAWAVGVGCCENGGDKTVTMRWNGTRWKVVASPNPSSTGDVLAGVAAVNVGKHPWAVGNTGHSDGGAGVLSLQWTGRRWAER